MALLLQRKATIQLITTIRMTLTYPRLQKDLRRKQLRISLMLLAPLRK